MKFEKDFEEGYLLRLWPPALCGKALPFRFAPIFYRQGCALPCARRSLAEG
jgi:hypothetical protein